MLNRKMSYSGESAAMVANTLSRGGRTCIEWGV